LERAFARSLRAPGLIDAAIEVAEPIGMETLVYFTIAETEVCARVSPAAGAREGARLKLAARLDNMHPIDEAGRVL
jgi:multiple sugar transport system ATP-binding protein